MSIFDFDPDFQFDPNIGKWEFTYRPYLFVKLGYKRKWSGFAIRALVDSGSDHNVFPAQDAIIIGLPYKQGIKHKIEAVDESAIVVYASRTRLSYHNNVLETVIYFGENVKIPVLGRNGFFNYFKKVSFDVKNRKFELV